MGRNQSGFKMHISDDGPIALVVKRGKIAD